MISAVASATSTPTTDHVTTLGMAPESGAPVTRFKVVKIDQRVPGKTGLKGEDPIPVTYKRGRWTVTDFYDGPSVTPCNSSPSTPTPSSAFSGPRLINPVPGTTVDSSQQTVSPPVITGNLSNLPLLVNPSVNDANCHNSHPSDLKITSENSNIAANRDPDVPAPPGLLSPEDRKLSLPNVQGQGLILQSPGKLGRKTSLHDSHKIGGFIVEPVPEPSDATTSSSNQPATNPVVTAVLSSEQSSSSSSSSSTVEASSSSPATDSPSGSDATTLVTVVQANPPAANGVAPPKNPCNNNMTHHNNSSSINSTSSNATAVVVATPPVNVTVQPAISATVPTAAAPVTASNTVQINNTAPTPLSDVTKHFSVTTVPEGDVLANPNSTTATDSGDTQQSSHHSTPMEVSPSPESTVSAADGAALSAAVAAVAETSSGMRTNSASPTDVTKVNVAGQTDHVSFVDETSLSSSVATTAPQSVSIPLVSSVAIDNKIEQAMDLVKSHLMFAVREEVDVLKEKIVELLERIQLLETENAILKQAHQNQLDKQTTHSLVTGIVLNTSPSPAPLEPMEMNTPQVPEVPTLAINQATGESSTGQPANAPATNAKPVEQTAGDRK